MRAKLVCCGIIIAVAALVQLAVVGPARFDTVFSMLVMAVTMGLVFGVFAEDN